MAGNTSTKRLMQELNELLSDPSPEFKAEPLESDILEWHFSIRGPPNSCYEGGRYHGRLLFPNDYPFKPPNIIFLTPNGRFQVGKKICLSITGYHPESWRPAWGVRTALTAIISFMLTPGEGSVGAVEWSDEARRIGAKESLDWSCSVCGSHNRTVLPSETEVPSVLLKGEEELVLSLPKSESLNDKYEQVNDNEKQGNANLSATSSNPQTDVNVNTDRSIQTDRNGSENSDAQSESKKSCVQHPEKDPSNPSTRPISTNGSQKSTTTLDKNGQSSASNYPFVHQTTTSSFTSVSAGAPLSEHDLVWKLDSLILFILGVIFSWFALRFL